MSSTQKYKQQQQQVRIHTNESVYDKGMWYTDTPLSEGYMRTLINYDIDSLSGALTPRKGLQSVGYVMPSLLAAEELDAVNNYSIVVSSKLCAVPDPGDRRRTDDYLQIITYNTFSRELGVITCKKDLVNPIPFHYETFKSVRSGTPEPFVLANPEIHGVKCAYTDYFKRPVGTFAYSDSFYTFINPRKPAKDGGTLARALKDTPIKSNADSTLGDLGTSTYYVLESGTVDDGTIIYYNADGTRAVWDGTEAEIRAHGIPDLSQTATLCYTKLGADIQPSELLLKYGFIYTDLKPQNYYICKVIPKELDPSEASSWGYNMLLKDPYKFICKSTAVNNVTILGIIPYDAAGKPILTPKINTTVSLKGYYRSPKTFHSTQELPQYYATAQQKVSKELSRTVLQYQDNETTGVRYYSIKDTGEFNVRFGYAAMYLKDDTEYTNLNSIQDYYKTITIDNKVINIQVDASTLATKLEEYTVETDPTSVADIERQTGFNIDEYTVGDWWHVYDPDVENPKSEYYIVVNKKQNDSSGNIEIIKSLENFGDTQPNSVEALPIYPLDTTLDLTQIRVKWEYRAPGAATWTLIQDNKIDTAVHELGSAPFTTSFTIPAEETMIKLTVYDPQCTTESPSGEVEEHVLSTMTIGLSSVSEDLASQLNISAENYDLAQCTGMCEWEQRLVLWGVPNALNTLFLSEVNNPGYFPYPNNIDIFPDPIISVHNYGSELLVLTTSALYRLTWDAEGSAWVHKLVQRNLRIEKSDTYIANVVKNMFFFKSGEQYYLMVPKAVVANSITGEVAIAPISKPIEHLLNNFHAEIEDLVCVITDKPDLKGFTEKLINYFSYVDNTKVCVNYVYSIGDQDNYKEKSEYLYVQLIYDTEVRTWTMRIFEAPHMLYASHIDAIQQDQFMDLTPYKDTLAVQFYKFQGTSDSATQYYDSTAKETPTAAVFKNYQYLDTGNREINTELKKRFREFQFKLKNTSGANIGFYTSFLVDGSLRRDLQRYKPRYITDSTTGMSTIVIERELDPETMVYKPVRVERVIVPERMLQDAGETTPTILGSTADLANPDADHWVLDQSAFPGRTFWKIRMPISGKGYTPRAILLSKNETAYELFGHSWAYRTMHAR